MNQLSRQDSIMIEKIKTKFSIKTIKYTLQKFDYHIRINFLFKF